MAQTPSNIIKLRDLRERALRLGHATAYNHFDRRIRELLTEQVSA